MTLYQCDMVGDGWLMYGKSGQFHFLGAKSFTSFLSSFVILVGFKLCSSLRVVY